MDQNYDNMDMDLINQKMQSNFNDLFSTDDINVKSESMDNNFEQ